MTGTDMNDPHTISIPSHQIGDRIYIWTAPRKPRRWWRFWNRGKTHFVPSTGTTNET